MERAYAWTSTASTYALLAAKAPMSRLGGRRPRAGRRARERTRRPVLGSAWKNWFAWRRREWQRETVSIHAS
eukprot:1763298-Pleurochrysis_carterae.AAC.1